MNIVAAFLDDEPTLESVAASDSRRDTIVAPFLIGTGAHAALDLPRRLSMSADGHSTLPRAELINGRLIVCASPIGTGAEFFDLIADLATEAADAQSRSGNVARRSGKASGSQERNNHRVRRWKLGTRGSKLALWQANLVADRLRSYGAIVDVETVFTAGDRNLEQPISQFSSDSPFTDEIEEALIRGDVDLAVHSLKDLPVYQSSALHLAAILRRGDASESLVSRHHQTLDQLPAGARVGTSSPRRRAQLLHLRDDLCPVDMRGPVDERVRQVREGRYDAAILATAGLERLGLMEEIAETLPLDRFVPPPGQAALAVQVRSDDAEAIRLVSPLDHRSTRLATDTELSCLREFDADASIAVAAYALVSSDITLRARLMSLDGDFMHQVVISGDSPASVAQDAARQLRAAISAEQR